MRAEPWFWRGRAALERRVSAGPTRGQTQEPGPHHSPPLPGQPSRAHAASSETRSPGARGHGTELQASALLGGDTALTIPGWSLGQDVQLEVGDIFETGHPTPLPVHIPAGLATSAPIVPGCPHGPPGVCHGPHGQDFSPDVAGAEAELVPGCLGLRLTLHRCPSDKPISEGPSRHCPHGSGGVGGPTPLCGQGSSCWTAAPVRSRAAPPAAATPARGRDAKREYALVITGWSSMAGLPRGVGETWETHHAPALATRETNALETGLASSLALVYQGSLFPLGRWPAALPLSALETPVLCLLARHGGRRPLAVAAVSGRSL